MATKPDLINLLHLRFEYLSKDDISFAIDKIIDHIKSELIKGNRIELRGFGSFSIRKRKYPGKEQFYDTIYYRMSKLVQGKLKNKNKNEPNLY